MNPFALRGTLPGTWAFTVGGLLACAASLAFLRVETFVSTVLAIRQWDASLVASLTLLGVVGGFALGGFTLVRRRWLALASIGVQIALPAITLVSALHLEARYSARGQGGEILTEPTTVAYLLLSAAACVFTGLALVLTRESRGRS